jgi:putative methyltransferase (TIGR04325 family)
MRKFLNPLVPKAARRWWRQRFGWRWFDGDYATWAEARAATQGYDDDAVIARAVAAARVVRMGTAVWERDGATFAVPAVNAPLLAALRTIATAEGGRLNVVDYGGALGSTWWQHRKALSDLSVCWCVVEQSHFVAAGQAEFSDGELNFELTLAAACARMEPAVILLSGVLPYLERPHSVLAEAVSSGVRHIVIDRTPFWGGGRDWLTVQRTPPSLGGGSYPAWVFDREILLAPLLTDFDCVQEWPGFDNPDPRLNYRGLHFSRKAVSA